MPWLLFLLALAALVGAPMVPSLVLGMLCVLASLLLTLCATMSLLGTHAAHAGAPSRQRRHGADPGLAPPP